MSQEQLAKRRRFFAAYYERTAQGKSEKEYFEPLRQKVVGLADGLVLEVGAGNGLNFPFYDPKRVERVEATEPDSAMLGYARARAEKAPVPVTLTRAPVEHLPFADASFDCVVSTLVFCSVDNPLRGLQEVRRVLKPDGTLLMVEHVRSHNAFLAFVQHLITPLTRLFIGNCHWNRRTEQTINQAGFQVLVPEHFTLLGGLVPMVLLVAKR